MAMRMRQRTARVVGVVQGTFQTLLGLIWLVNPTEARIEGVRWLNELDIVDLERAYDLLGVLWVSSGLLLVFFSILKSKASGWAAFYVSFIVPFAMAAIFMVGQLDRESHAAYLFALVYIWFGLPVALVHLTPVHYNDGVQVKVREVGEPQ